MEATGQKNVTVLDLTDLQGATTELGRFLAQELSDQLVAVAKQISVVDRANMQYLLREKNLSAEGFVNPESSKKIGNLIGIDTVVLGSITPLGQNIRMSLRAIALETGKVVASQSTSLPVTGDLSALYNRGVSNNPSSLSDPAVTSTSDPKSRFRGDSVRFKGKEITIYNCNAEPVMWCDITAHFSVENLSGIGFNTAVKDGATSIGPCVGSTGLYSGISVMNGREVAHIGKQDNPEQMIGTYFAAGARIEGTVTFGRIKCATAFRGVRAADISMTLAVAPPSGTSFFFPLSASQVPVRSASQRQ